MLTGLWTLWNVYTRPPWPVAVSAGVMVIIVIFFGINVVYCRYFHQTPLIRDTRHLRAAGVDFDPRFLRMGWGPWTRCTRCGKEATDLYRDEPICSQCLRELGAPAVVPPARFCRECGAKIPRDSIYCEECGTTLA